MTCMNFQKFRIFRDFLDFPFLARAPFGEHHLAAFRFKEIDHGESIGARNFRKSRKMRDEMGVQGIAVVLAPCWISFWAFGSASRAPGLQCVVEFYCEVGTASRPGGV